jgi:hypothetical protein
MGIARAAKRMDRRIEGLLHPPKKKKGKKK